MRTRHLEYHRTGQSGWLRATVLGANDGILSTASLVLGVAAAHGSRSAVLVAGIAGLVAGAMSMAAGEYVSVHSQADTEKADLERERAELRTDERGEHAELAAIYVGRGLDPVLARQVAKQLISPYSSLLALVAVCDKLTADREVCSFPSIFWCPDTSANRGFGGALPLAGVNNPVPYKRHRCRGSGRDRET